MDPRPIILSIAGYDPTSGAGVTADVKTSAALGCYAVTCITALTVQSTQRVFEVEPLRPELVRQMLRKLSEDVEFAAVRIGMLGSEGIANVVAEFLRQVRPPNVVLDPVLRSSSGTELIDSAGLTEIRSHLLPLCDVITPNLEEAAYLVDSKPVPASDPWDQTLPRLRELAGKLHQLGCRAVVITGGHLPAANDYLSYVNSAGSGENILRGTHLESTATHGTGCAFATALACGLARNNGLLESVQQAKAFVRSAILSAYPVGKGIGPMNHLFRLDADE